MTHLPRCLIVAALVAASPCLAQTAPPDYPNRTVRIIVPFAPAGPSDVIARLLAQKLSESLGKQFYVENEGGAGGNIGMGAAAKAPPDGHTLLVVSSSFVVNPSLYEKAPYDPVRDFTPITLAAVSPQVLLVNAGLPVKSVAELIDYLKANPAKANFASPGAGTTGHLAGEMFRLSLGLDLVHVPFNGAGPTINAMIGNQVTMAFTALPPAASNIKAGTLRALAVTSARRSPAFPDVPTLAEAGVPDQESDVMQGILAPAGTPPAIVALLNREIVRIVGLPDVKDKLAALGFEPVADRPEQFGARIRAEVAKWGKVVRDAKIKVQ